MPTVRQPLPRNGLLFEIVWEPGCLGSAALAVVDVLRLINGIAALESPAATPPARWRWLGCDGRPAKPPALGELPAHERHGAVGGKIPSAYRDPADVVVIPGWMVRDGPEIDRWVARSSALISHLQQTLERGGALLGVFTGVALLAAAGCLHQRRFAAPWPFFVSVMRHASLSGYLAAESVDWSDAPDWTCDHKVWSCASPVATTEAVLNLIGATPLRDLSSAARDVLIPQALRQAVTVQHARTESPHLARNRVPSGIVERARQWLIEHLVEPYDVQSLARAVGTSPRSLARHFSATYGMSARDYLERLRVERACLLLQTTYVTVEEIGRSSGLESPSTFRRVFFKHTGTLPSEYRHRYRLRIKRPLWGSEVRAPSAREIPTQGRYA
jgi:transcriptional regulator GlxA family with amidase domain